MLTRSANAVDIHVGRRVRTARLAQRISQEKLAEAVGVSFQQIQKYEKGVNRIGTGRLHAIARFFDLPVTYFFDGIDKHSGKPSRDSGMTAMTEALSTKEGTRIAVALSRIHSAKMRRRIADLLEAIMKEEREQARAMSA
ncbi:MAG TPA: helix-turn-helix transcriptional regulator [Xanthobacteraceae bacterium]|nr:helix-turn-helix transcriptional regulator [Xanthobacteraceae bacterium]